MAMYTYISLWRKCKNGTCGNYVKTMIFEYIDRMHQHAFQQPSPMSSYSDKIDFMSEIIQVTQCFAMYQNIVTYDEKTVCPGNAQKFKYQALCNSYSAA